MMNIQETKRNIAKKGLAALIVTLCVLKKKRSVKRIVERRWWERPHLGVQQRSVYGQQNLLQDMRISDPESFTSILRLRPASFDKLLYIVGPLITKRSNRKPINPSTRLAVTLRYLATGEELKSLAYNYRLGESTINGIVKETLGAIYNALKPIVLPEPTEEKWLEITEGFLRRWNVPNCCGAVDGKHVRTIKASKTGSEFYCYKKFFSTVMMAIADSEYKFVAADTGSQGRNNDAVVLQESGIGKKLMSGTFGLPGEREIMHGPVLPHFILGDEIFGLKPYLMVPYPGRGTGKLSYTQKIFNYRQSRGRRVVENMFGIFASVWGIFGTEINATPDTVDRIVMAAVCLHNFRIMEKESNAQFLTRPAALGRNRTPCQMQSIEEPLYADATERRESEFIRNELAQYFTSGGRVYWQDNLIH